MKYAREDAVAIQENVADAIVSLQDPSHTNSL
jgi:hypothetical protein